jgi:hypothetical protein
MSVSRGDHERSHGHSILSSTSAPDRRKAGGPPALSSPANDHAISLSASIRALLLHETTFLVKPTWTFKPRPAKSCLSTVRATVILNMYGFLIPSKILFSKCPIEDLPPQEIDFPRGPGIPPYLYMFESVVPKTTPPTAAPAAMTTPGAATARPNGVTTACGHTELESMPAVGAGLRIDRSFYIRAMISIMQALRGASIPVYLRPFIKTALLQWPGPGHSSLTSAMAIADMPPTAAPRVPPTVATPLSTCTRIGEEFVT